MGTESATVPGAYDLADDRPRGVFSTALPGTPLPATFDEPLHPRFAIAAYVIGKPSQVDTAQEFPPWDCITTTPPPRVIRLRFEWAEPPSRPNPAGQLTSREFAFVLRMADGSRLTAARARWSLRDDCDIEVLPADDTGGAAPGAVLHLLLDPATVTGTLRHPKGATMQTVPAAAAPRPIRNILDAIDEAAAVLRDALDSTRTVDDAATQAAVREQISEGWLAIADLMGKHATHVAAAHQDRAQPPQP